VTHSTRFVLYFGILRRRPGRAYLPPMSLANVADEVTEASAEESANLRRHFGRCDLVFFLICTIVGLDTIGSVAKNGAQGFTWLLFLGVLFSAPYALLTAELGSAFPAEGGPYVWTRLAFGRFIAEVNSVIYWAANPIWLGGSLTITAIAQAPARSARRCRR
jgi:glutamate:GABA antiporter